MKIYLAQINPTVGALEANATLIRAAYENGVKGGAELVVVPELAVTGYPPRDLLDKALFVDANLRVRDSLAEMTGETALVFGCVTRNETGFGKPFRNTAVVVQNGRVIHQQSKTLLPTYDVFDELRYFEPATEVAPVEVHGQQIGVLICEDFWFNEEMWGRKLYRINPVRDILARGAEVLINISASPFNAGKRETRYGIFRAISKDAGVPLVYCNQVGGNDEILFDGSSLVLNAKGESVFCGKSFEEDDALVPLDGSACPASGNMPLEEEVGKALILGLRDYIRKCGFSDVVVGLSGGIDSAVTAAIAVEALGPAHVAGIAMPSRFSSKSSIDNARDLAQNLGIDFHLVEVDAIFAAYLDAFRGLYGERPFGVAEENVQARIRGNLLMAWSNKTGAMVLATGNKSEMAVGYCTLYGDMSGGLALLGDVFKTLVYRIAEWLNRDRQVIPRSSITKPPSAELRPDQTDQDYLPPYETLDEILRLYIEEWKELPEIVEAGFDRATVERVLRMVDGNEFKRRQAAPTLRVSTKAFGSGRQMPIAQRWRQENGFPQPL